MCCGTEKLSANTMKHKAKWFFSELQMQMPECAGCVSDVQGKQGVQGAYALVRGGSSTSNPSRTTSLQKDAHNCMDFEAL